MRPIQLKLALLFCVLGLVIDLAYIPLNKELYDGHWFMFFGVKSAISFIWLILLILIFRGFGGLRYVYSLFVVWGVGRIIYSGVLVPLDIYVYASLLLSIFAAILWFLPASNEWFKQTKKGA